MNFRVTSNQFKDKLEMEKFLADLITSLEGTEYHTLIGSIQIVEHKHLQTP